MRLTFSCPLRGFRSRNGWFSPVAGAGPDLAVRFGLLERPGHLPVLIDAGWPDRRPGESLALRLYRALLRPRIDAASTPAAVLGGREPAAVLLSHLHADHVGAVLGLGGVPVHGPARALAHARRHPWSALRHGVMTELLPDTVHDLEGGMPLPFGLGRGRDVLGDGSVLSVPLPEHARDMRASFPAFGPARSLWRDVCKWGLARHIAENLPPPTGAGDLWPFRARAMESLARVRAFAPRGPVVLLPRPGAGARFSPHDACAARPSRLGLPPRPWRRRPCCGKRAGSRPGKAGVCGSGSGRPRGGGAFSALRSWTATSLIGGSSRGLEPASVSRAEGGPRAWRQAAPPPARATMRV